MKRRDFLSAGLGVGFGLPVSVVAQDSQTGKAHAIAEGGALTAPSDKPIQVAIAISAGTTLIDFVGPQAVFETWHFDPVEKKHKPSFKIFYVSEKLEPVS